MKRHPPHLVGKEIGLYYSKLKKQRDERNSKPLGAIFLSESKKKQISTLLEQNKQSPFTCTNNESFRNNFVKIVNGKINDKLQFTTSVSHDKVLDEAYFNQFLESKVDLKYKLMLKKRMKLPAYDMQQEIVDIIGSNQICVISGETGCGKTTQVAQFILDDYLMKSKGSACKIICTQPRRISAISVALRVAEERAEKLGNTVGYQIRLEKELPRAKGSITFCTTGVILKQMESNPSLDGVSHLILDEIHERDIMSDFIISLMKKVVAKRKDLKLILMSATLNSEKFSKYYGNCPMLEIPGFTYHVEEYYLEDAINDTKFEFETPFVKKPKKGRDFYKRSFVNKRHKEYHSQFGPYLRQLRFEKKYSEHVIQQLENPICEELNLKFVLQLIIYICEKMKEVGAILVFLPGFSEISQLHILMQTNPKFSNRDYLILPLHSQMPTVDQRQIFDPPPKCIKRKIILSTNIAETSITIDDVVYVIDCGTHKMKRYNPETNSQTLLPEWVTLANARQRKGRAGRVKPGICYHLYHKGREQMFNSYPEPEILRTRLEDVILMIKILQLGQAQEFLNSLLDKPDSKVIDISVDLLQRMNALDDNENLTPLGFHLARLPVHPQIGKMLLLGSIFSCLDPILSVAVSLDYKDAFQLPLGKVELAELKKLQLADECKSDHLLNHIALSRFEEQNPWQAKNFCWEYFLSYYTLTLQQNMKHQFMKYLYEMDFVPDVDPKCRDVNRNSDNMSLVKAIICAGLYPNVVINRMKKLRNILYTMNHKRVHLHKKSVLAMESVFESPFLVYYIRMKSSSDFIHDATIVHPLPLIFFGDKYAEHEENGVTSLSVNNNCLKFKSSKSTMSLISELRNQLNNFLEYKVSNPGFLDWTADSAEIKMLIAIMELITNEDTGEIDLTAYDDDDDDDPDV